MYNRINDGLRRRNLTAAAGHTVVVNRHHHPWKSLKAFDCLVIPLHGTSLLEFEGQTDTQSTAMNQRPESRHCGSKKVQALM